MLLFKKKEKKIWYAFRVLSLWLLMPIGICSIIYSETLCILCSLLIAWIQGTEIVDESYDQDTTDLHKCVKYILGSLEKSNVSSMLIFLKSYRSYRYTGLFISLLSDLLHYIDNIYSILFSVEHFHSAQYHVFLSNADFTVIDLIVQWWLKLLF